MSRYACVYDLRGEFSTAEVCKALDVPRASYYAWVKRGRVMRSRPSDEASLVKMIETIHEESRGTYGVPRVCAQLRIQGYCVNHKRVQRIMSSCNIVGISGRKGIKTTIRSGTEFKILDLVKRDFTAGEPHKKYCGDITYINTKQGTMYLATVIDIGSRKCVGWSMADHMRTSLVSDALDAARAMSGRKAPEIFHSDRGSQYTSADFATQCGAYGISQSMGARGVCWDNAIAESFFSTYKREILDDGKRVFESMSQARTETFAWIQGWYNKKRLHSSLGMVTPERWEQLWEEGLLHFQEIA